MSDLKRLLDEGSPFERTLLQSSDSEGPSRGLEDKILAALATLPASANAAEGSTVLRTPTAASPARPKSLRPIAFATVAVGLIVGAAVIELARTPSVESPAPAAPSTLRAPTAPTTPAPHNDVPTVSLDSLPSAPPPEVSARSVPAAPRPAATASSQGAPLDDASSIEREIALLDGVKAKLGAGAAADAARTLDTYDAEFPNGTLRPEATVLRIRTLLVQGRRAEAQRLADEFLAKHPSSVHAKRIRALLSE